MQPDVVKITSHTGIAASIPYLLGFHPSESLVVIGLENNRLVFTMRMDLQPAHLEGALVTEALRRMSEFDQVIVAVYTDETSGETLPRSVLVERLLASLDVREALLVRNDRVW